MRNFCRCKGMVCGDEKSLQLGKAEINTEMKN